MEEELPATAAGECHLPGDGGNYAVLLFRGRRFGPSPRGWGKLEADTGLESLRHSPPGNRDQ